MKIVESELPVYLRLTRALRTLPQPAAPEDLGRRALARVAARVQREVRFSPLETAIGRIYLAYGPRGIRFVAPAGAAEAFTAAYQKRFRSVPVPDETPPARLLADVARALDGDRRAARRLPLDLDSLGTFE